PLLNLQIRERVGGAKDFERGIGDAEPGDGIAGAAYAHRAGASRAIDGDLHVVHRAAVAVEAESASAGNVHVGNRTVGTTQAVGTAQVQALPEIGGVVESNVRDVRVVSLDAKASTPTVPLASHRRRNRKEIGTLDVDVQDDLAGTIVVGLVDRRLHGGLRPGC